MCDCCLFLRGGVPHGRPSPSGGTRVAGSLPRGEPLVPILPKNLRTSRRIIKISGCRDGRGRSNAVLPGSNAVLLQLRAADTQVSVVLSTPGPRKPGGTRAEDPSGDQGGRERERGRIARFTNLEPKWQQIIYIYLFTNNTGDA